jgi:hypothetical protein
MDGVKIQRSPVGSSWIKSIGYEAVKKLLHVETKDGTVYEYENVEPGAHHDFLHAKSHGRHFSSVFGPKHGRGRKL